MAHIRGRLCRSRMCALRGLASVTSECPAAFRRLALAMTFPLLGIHLLSPSFPGFGHKKDHNRPFGQLRSSRSLCVFVFHGPLRRLGAHFAPALFIPPSHRSALKCSALKYESSITKECGTCKLDVLSRVVISLEGASSTRFYRKVSLIPFPKKCIFMGKPINAIMTWI